MLKKCNAQTARCGCSNPLAWLEQISPMTMRGSGTVGTGLERYASNFYSVKRCLFQPFQPFHSVAGIYKYVGKWLISATFFAIWKNAGTDGTLGTLGRC